MRSARARGLGGARVLLRHALPPALLPVVSYLGPAVAFVVTGSLVVETVFGLPGTGRYLVQGAIDRDYPLVMGMIVVYAVLTLLAELPGRPRLRLARPERAPWLKRGRPDPRAVACGRRRRLMARRAAPLAALGLAALVALALLGPALSPHRYDGLDWQHLAQPPGALAAHWFGTDRLGRDLYVRALLRAAPVAPGERAGERGEPR